MNNGIEKLDNIFNDNEGKYKPSNTQIDLPPAAVDRIADMLEEKLHGGTESRSYYCWVARQLPAQTLERLADTAHEIGRHPGKLFTFLTKHEMSKRGRGG